MFICMEVRIKDNESSPSPPPPPCVCHNTHTVLRSVPEGNIGEADMYMHADKLKLNSKVMLVPN